LSVALAASLVASVGACTKPKAPQLTPKEAKITSVDLGGFEMRVKVDAFNPNTFPLSVRGITAHVIVDGTQDLGTVTASQPIDLPAGVHTPLDVPMSVKWKGIGGLATIAASKRAVSYVVDGTATVGGESLNVDVPFKLQGTITAEQLQQSALKSLQNLPALQGLPRFAPTK
jgi:LEA14-like dessication related protein